MPGIDFNCQVIFQIPLLLYALAGSFFLDNLLEFLLGKTKAGSKLGLFITAGSMIIVFLFGRKSDAKSISDDGSAKRE